MLEKTIEFAATIQADDFKCLFARVSGWVGAEARENPKATCTMKEVGELFTVLFERMHGRNDETPAAGTAGESK